MSTLSNLESRLSRLKSQKKSIESNLSTYRDRKKDVEKIRDKLVDVVDDSYGGINKIVGNICDGVFGAIVGSLFGTNVNSSVTESKEKGSGSDSQVINALNDLRTELSNINKKINNWENDLASVKRQIDNTEREIREERKRKLEEAKNFIDSIIH